MLPLDGDRIPSPLLNTQFNERLPSLSPDARWLAYESDESGRTEVY
ncbi:MAG: PD40 domain-containing protein [Deltaproteobacteria bacterium]|nr:PD40 domain-containing protein [Deltaproteobacteria bacterium]